MTATTGPHLRHIPGEMQRPPHVLVVALALSAGLHVLVLLHLQLPDAAARSEPEALHVDIRQTRPASRPETQASAPSRPAAKRQAAESARQDRTVTSRKHGADLPRGNTGIDWNAAIQKALLPEDDPDAALQPVPYGKPDPFPAGLAERHPLPEFAREFSPPPGPHKVCGRMMTLQVGLRSVEIPVSYLCDPGEKPPSDIPDDAAGTPAE